LPQPSGVHIKRKHQLLGSPSKPLERCCGRGTRGNGRYEGTDHRGPSGRQERSAIHRHGRYEHSTIEPCVWRRLADIVNFTEFGGIVSLER
jgi:hypothetical protein